MILARIYEAGISAIIFAPLAAMAQSVTATAPATDPFKEKVTIAVVSAILSLLTGYILLQFKERREPKKRLSYDLEARRGLLGIEEAIARHLSITYKGIAAKDITYIRCDVKNTGNTVIKEQYLRFVFGEGSQLLDSYTDPIPPREYGVAEAPEGSLQPHEKRFKIQHLEKQQQVDFRFVISGSPDREVEIVPYNAEGDVEVTAGSISRAADDRRRAEQFVLLFLLTLLLPPLFRWLPSFIMNPAISILYIILTAAMIPLLKPFSRMISAAIVTLSRPTQPELSIEQLIQDRGAVLNIVTGGVAEFQNPLSSAQGEDHDPKSRSSEPLGAE